MRIRTGLNRICSSSTLGSGQKRLLVVMTISDALLVLSALVGPIAAVQVQKWIERARERRNRKLWVFQTLMATRAVRAGSLEHVQALNSIELFFNSKSTAEKEIREAWAVYLDFLATRLADGTAEPQVAAHNEKGVDLLISLLQKLGKSLGYDFNIVQLKKGAYYPQMHANEGQARKAIMDGLVRLLSGNQAVQMEVTSLPVTPEAVAKQLEVQAALLKTLAGETAIKVHSE